MKRKLGLDIGDVRIGISVSDLLGMIANPRESYCRSGEEKDMDYLSALIKTEDADTVVIGLPVNMNGTEGRRAELVRDFGGKLKEYLPESVKIVYQDERLSTVAAEKVLISADVRRDKRKQVIDKVAACIILQSFLDRRA